MHLKKLMRNIFELLQSISHFIVHKSHEVQTNNNNNNNNNNYHSSFQFNKLYNTIHTNVIHIFRVLTQTKRPVINQQPPFTGILVHEGRIELHDGDHPCRRKVTCLLKPNPKRRALLRRSLITSYVIIFYCTSDWLK